MRRSLLLILTFSVMVTMLVVLFSIAASNLRQLMGWQENGFIVWVVLILAALRWWRSRKVWHGGLAFAVCNLFAWWAFRLHREDVRLVFDRLGNVLLWVTILDDDGKWRRRLWGKLKSVGLTAINAATFRRQTKEAFEG